MKPAVPGRADDAEPGNDEGGEGQRHLAADPAEVGELHGADAIHHGAEREEQRALHHRMIEEVDDAAREPVLVREADAERDVADLRNRRIRQHALQVLLVHRQDRGHEHGGHRKREQHVADAESLQADGDAEDGEENAQQQVDRNLGRGRRQEGGGERGRVGVGIGQPHVQRKERKLQADADREEGQRHHDRPRTARPKPARGGSAMSTMLRLPVTR